MHPEISVCAGEFPGMLLLSHMDSQPCSSCVQGWVHPAAVCRAGCSTHIWKTKAQELNCAFGRAGSIRGNKPVQGKLPSSSSLLWVGTNPSCSQQSTNGSVNPLLSPSCALLQPWWVYNARDNHHCGRKERRTGGKFLGQTMRVLSCDGSCRDTPYPFSPSSQDHTVLLC